ncbi:MAG: hypothetical protein AB1646_19920 [Thermodesulfobacteriota bacterium]
MDSTVCVICGLPETPDNPLCEEGFYQDTWIHLRCYNLPETRAWREPRAAEDPNYRRYGELITAGFPVACPGCGLTNHLFPKSIGHSPTWELCCTECGEVDTEGINPYLHRETVQKLQRLYDTFLRAQDFSQVEPAVREIAQEFERTHGAKPCHCGGRFSITGVPRCRGCREILLDSAFHYAEPVES